MEQKISADAMLIKNMAEELGISPLDIFMNWVKTGEITNVTINIHYKNGDVVRADLAQGNFVLQPVKQSERNPSQTKLNFDEETPLSKSKQINTTGDDASQYCKETSFSLGTIRIKPEQIKNIIIGAYVYTTGDVLLECRALPNVNVRGIILSHSKDKIVLLKCVGSGFTAVTSQANVKDGWRFLTSYECSMLVKHKEQINPSLQKMKRKQIDNSMLLVCRGSDDNLYCYDSLRGILKKAINKDEEVDRTFYLYMVKDLKIV